AMELRWLAAGNGTSLVGRVCLVLAWIEGKQGGGESSGAACAGYRGLVRGKAIGHARSMGRARALGKGQRRNSRNERHKLSFSASGTDALAGLEDGSATSASFEPESCGIPTRFAVLPLKARSEEHTSE